MHVNAKVPRSGALRAARFPSLHGRGINQHATSRHVPAERQVLVAWKTLPRDLQTWQTRSQGLSPLPRPGR